MYYWKTHLLVDAIKRGTLQDNDYKNYYLATSILAVLAMYLAMAESREDWLAMTAEGIGVLAVTIFGINAAFTANGGALGARFVEKAVSISFPLLVKFALGAIGAGIVIGIWQGLGAGECLTEWASAVVMVLLQAAFYWRLTVHVRHSNS